MGDQPGQAARDYRETLFLPETAFSMKAGLPKSEPAMLARWADENLYAQLRADAAGRTPFVLHDGPPYANGHLHIGHALNKILKDMIIRARQMSGFDADYVPGWDCHGLPIEWKVEELFRAEGRAKDDVPAAEFRARCRAYAAEWVDIQRAEFKRMGVIGDWDRPYLTMAFAAEATIVAEFLKVAMGGLLYRGSKPVMWSPVEATSLAEAEVEYQEKQSHTIWVKFPVRGQDAAIVIWTTTPWTIPANRAIAFAPAIAYGLYRVEALESDLRFEPWAKPGEKLALADALAEAVFAAAKIARWTRLGGFDPAGLVCDHPLAHWAGAPVGAYGFGAPLLAGEHVTAEAGTGFVHTAPGHGQEDFALWLASGGAQQDIPFTVDGDGRFTEAAPGFAGLSIIELEGKRQGQDGPANEAVIQALIAAGALLARGRLTHQYPHSWRSKAPLIFRNTPQWFIALDRPGPRGATLREEALAAIASAAWIPQSGANRIGAMVSDRPDWLVSRQRAWGVPLTLFVHKETGDILRDEAVNARIVAAVEAEGADAWWLRPAQDFLGQAYAAGDYERVDDILDVWFDSGASHAFVLGARESLPFPADLYLEGSDQHRGWFQSSLLESCATRGRAPYKSVLTHGFVLDEAGRKMSKSLGNVVEPQKIADQFGIEILRLWAASSDYSEDLRLGKTIIDQSAEMYRKLRNTLRYLLGALHGFSDAERLDWSDPDFPRLELWLAHRLDALDREVQAGFDAYDFRGALSKIVEFCNVDLSPFYFDVRKDSLYCDRPEAVRRRACRTLLDLLFDRLTAWLAPILPFTAEEAWAARFPEARSVHLRQFPGSLALLPEAGVAAGEIEALRGVRRVVTGALERERREKRMGASLEAAPVLYLADPALAALVDRVGLKELADLCITSAMTVGEGPAPAGAFALPEQPGVVVVPARAAGRKCARSWRYFDPAEADPRYPDLSPRDADAVAQWDAARAPNLKASAGHAA